jgi:hypothetical protein
MKILKKRNFRVLMCSLFSVLLGAMTAGCSSAPATATGSRYSLYGFSTGMTYSQVKAKAESSHLRPLRDGADRLSFMATNSANADRPLVITLILAHDDRVKEVRVQEMNGTDDVDVAKTAVKQWGEPTRAHDPQSYAVKEIWGNLNHVHAEVENQVYNPYAGCVCIHIIDPSFSSIEAANKGKGHGPVIADQSVTGIALGSSLDAAVSQLLPQGFLQGSVRFPWPDEAAVMLNMGSMNPTEQYWFQEIYGKIVRIRHVVHFATEKRPSIEDTVASLRKKYGRTATENIPEDTGDNHQYRFSWSYDADGRAKSQEETVCDMKGLQPNQWATIPRLGSAELVRETDPACARGASAEIQYDAASGLVTGMVVDLYDYRTLNAFIDAKVNDLRNKPNRSIITSRQSKISQHTLAQYTKPSLSPRSWLISCRRRCCQADSMHDCNLERKRICSVNFA